MALVQLLSKCAHCLTQRKLLNLPDHLHKELFPFYTGSIQEPTLYFAQPPQPLFQHAFDARRHRVPVQALSCDPTAFCIAHQTAAFSKSV